MSALIVVLGLVSMAIIAVCLGAVRNKDLEEYRESIVIGCAIAVGAVFVVGILAYSPEPRIAVVTPDNAQQAAPPRADAQGTVSSPADNVRIDAVGEIQETAATVQSVGEIFSDCSDCPEMVVIPAGDNNIGEEENTPGTRANESPLAWVRYRENFAVSRYEIEVGEFKAFAAATGFTPSGPCNTDGVGGANADYSNPGLEQAHDHPVVCVSAGDAERYVRWLTERTGYTYSLLSEARWEYVRRGVTSAAKQNLTPAEDDMPDIGNIRGENWIAATIDVGRYYSNPFLIYDMMGNVGEWTADCWQETHLHQPKDGSAIRASGDCTARAVRGGSWDERASEARPASRRKVLASARDWRIGFRVMRTLVDATRTTGAAE